MKIVSTFSNSLVHSSHFCFGFFLVFSLGSFILQPIALLGDLLTVELVSKLHFIHSSTTNEHTSDDKNCGGKNDEVVKRWHFTLMSTKFKVGPPMKELDNIEEYQHYYDLYVIIRGILVNLRVISTILWKIGTSFLRLCKIVSSGRSYIQVVFLSHCFCFDKYKF